MGHKTWVDSARAVGIMRVVVGHVLAAAGPLYSTVVFLIFLFHMPLFFMLSGAVHKVRGVKENAVRRAETLLVPYVAFVTLIFVADFVLANLMGREPSVRGVGGILRLTLGGSFAMGKYGVLWFATCLFIVGVLYDLALSRSSPTGRPMLILLAFLMLASAVIAVVAPSPNPWGVFAVPAAFVAYWFGGRLGEARFGKRQLIGFSVAAVVAAIVCHLAGLNIAFDMKALKFGPPVVGLALALAMSLGFIAGCSLSKGAAFGFLNFVGQQSLTIMMLHQLVHFTLRDAGVENVVVLIIASLVVPLAIAELMRLSNPTRRIFLGRR